VRIGAEIESVAASTKAAKVVNSEREEDNIYFCIDGASDGHVTNDY
jgi:hypothetical protein